MQITSVPIPKASGRRTDLSTLEKRTTEVIKEYTALNNIYLHLIEEFRALHIIRRASE